MRDCWSFNLGQIEYEEALQLQRSLVSLKQSQDLPEILLLLEHNPVITFGRAGREGNLLSDQDTLKQAGVKVFYIERGGDVTFHGPGQLVAYPIFDLNHWKRDMHLFLRNLEEVIILTLREYNLRGERIKGLTGVWVEGKKIGAIGVAVKKWISLHGLALNVNTDLSYFEFIHPCGIKDRPVTSMREMLGKEINLEDVAELVRQKFSEVFSLNIQTKPADFLQRLVSTQVMFSH